jgi:hypothetical protein
VTGNATYSIEAWILNESPPVGEETIFSWGRRTGTGVNASFNHGTDPNFGCMGHFGAPDLGWGGTPNVHMDRWTHVVYTYNANTFTQYAYVDGVQVSSEILGAPLAIAVTNSVGGLVPFRVGCQTGNTGTPSTVGRPEGLSIAELRVYTLTLSASDILSKFNVGANLYGITDTDGDGIPSWWERKYSAFMNENNPADAGMDFDGDGLTNLEEYQQGTDPTKSDTDGDGLSDGAEVHTYGSNPLNPDTDVDGLRDGREVALGTLLTGFGSNDSDSDGFPDSTEVLYGSNPTNSASMPDLSTPIPYVNLDATSLPVGPLVNWTNNNALGWVFTAPSNAVASVASVEGTKGVQFFGTNHYVGPNIPSFFGGTAARTVEAWIYNPTAGAEETVFAWGRRGGNPDGSNSAFSHGTDASFGALQFWGAPDVAWGTNAAQIAANVISGRWTHVAYTYGIENGTNGVRACYVNGAFANSEVSTNLALINTFTFDPLDPLNAPPNNFGRTLPFRVGAQSQADGTFDPGAARPTMTIARIKAYDVALTAARIAADFNAERAAFPGAPRITNVRVNPANGFISFDWVPAPGRTYEVQRNTDVINSAGWSSIATGQNSGSFTDNQAGASRNYYRLRLE